MIALIDADILVYEASYRSQRSVEWEEGEFTNFASLPEAQTDFANCIVAIEDATESQEVILALTDHDRDTNFRRTLWPSYKGHRDGVAKQRPLLYKAMRQWVRETYNVKQKPGIEADDTIGILATGHINGLPPVEERVICSVDKDLLTIPGHHYNWRKKDAGVVYVTEEEAFLQHMFQTLVGDSSDGYPGCPGVGPLRAAEILRDTDGLLPHDIWERVVLAFTKRGLTEGDALIQARCARILQACDWDFDTNTVVLWTPPKESE